MGFFSSFIEETVDTLSAGTIELDLDDFSVDLNKPSVGGFSDLIAGPFQAEIENQTGLSAEEQLLIGGVIGGGVVLAGGAGGAGGAVAGGAAGGAGAGIGVGGAIGIGVGLLGIGAGILAADEAKDEAREQARINSQFAQTQEVLTIARIGSQKERALKSLTFEERKDALLSRLQEISIKRKGNIIGARQRSQAQQARIGGVGGSFSVIRSGATELRTEVETQLSQARIEKGLRADQRRLTRTGILEEARFGVGQAQLTSQATQAGAAAHATAAINQANISAVQSTIQFGTQILNNPAVAQAINTFFSSDDVG